MPKPINETISRCSCRVKNCEAVAEVRRMKNHDLGAQYLVCPVHGVDRVAAKFQAALDDFIANNEIESEKNPEPEPVPAPVVAPVPEPRAGSGPVPVPVPVPEPPETGPGFLSSANKELNDFWG